MKIDSIEKLRNHILESLDKLDKEKITIEELGTIAKAAETISSTLKLQLSYAHMRNELPRIDFLQRCHQVETADTKKLK